MSPPDHAGASVIPIDRDGARPAVGRPRDPMVDEAILAAARELLAAVGYRRLALDAVARRAGVSRTSLRLRWKSKAELVFEAVVPDADVLTVPDTGSLAGDLRGCVANTVALLRWAPMRAAFQGLLDDARNHPDVRDALSARIYRPSLEGFEGLLERALDRGEIVRRIDADVLLDLIAGSLLYRLSVSGEDPAALEEQLVSLLVAGLGAADVAGAGRGGASAGVGVGRAKVGQARQRPKER